MTDLEIIINAITGINYKDKLKITKFAFFCNSEIAKIIKKRRINRKERKKLYDFACKLCKINNVRLNNNNINSKNISDFFFIKIKSYDDEKWNQLCNIIQYYFDEKKVNIKKLEYRLNILDKKNYNMENFILAKFVGEDKHYITKENAYYHNIVSLLKPTDIESNYYPYYEFEIDNDNYEFIISILDRITTKQKNQIATKILNLDFMERKNTLLKSKKYIKKVNKKIKRYDVGIKAYREESKELKKYKDEYIPLIRYAESLNKKENKIRVEFNGYKSDKGDGKLYYDEKMEIVEITTSGKNKEYNKEMKILNLVGAVGSKVFFPSTIIDNISNEVYVVFTKKDNKPYKPDTTLLINISNSYDVILNDLEFNELIDKIKEKITSSKTFSKVLILYYDKQGKSNIEKIL